MVKRNGKNVTVPLLISGGGGGRSDSPGDNDPDAGQLFVSNQRDLAAILERGREQQVRNTSGGDGGGWNSSTSYRR